MNANEMPTPLTDAHWESLKISGTPHSYMFESMTEHAENIERQLVTLTAAFSEWPRLREWMEMDPFIRGYMSAEKDAFDAMSNSLKP